MAIEEKIKQLLDNREKAKLGGGIKRIDAQHAKGKLTAREESKCCWIRTASRNLICL